MVLVICHSKKLCYEIFEQKVSKNLLSKKVGESRLEGREFHERRSHNEDAVIS